MKRAWVVAGAALALASASACARAGSSEDDAFGRRVRAYLLAHPEVLVEVQQKLQVRQDADEAAQEQKAKADLPLLRGRVERDPRDFVANPDGKVTVTEFYDYRCPHCANVAPRVLDLIAADHDIRFVFKEMPIFGPASQHAARAAMAVKKAGGDYLGLYRALMATKPLDDETIDRLALAHGARPADLADSAAARGQLSDTTTLFTRLDLGGTPAFIVGDDIVYGEDMEGLTAAIARTRATQAKATATAKASVAKASGAEALMSRPAVASNAHP